MPFRHVVMFRWVDSMEPTQVDVIRARLNALPSLIPEIRTYVHGNDAQVVDGNFHYVVTADFDDAAGWFTYRDHPAHTAMVAEDIYPYVAERAAIQFEYA